MYEKSSQPEAVKIASMMQEIATIRSKMFLLRKHTMDRVIE